MKIIAAGEGAAIAYFSDQPDPDTCALIQHSAKRLPGLLGTALVDLVPSYTSLLVVFDPLQADPSRVRQALMASINGCAVDRQSDTRMVELPSWYSRESGPDLEDLAARAGLSIEDVIELHQQQEYRVYAIGFAPGFAYLGEVDPRIAGPRHATPRARVPRGSVAIAERQTAVYPSDSPGGWNLIGLCPVTLFDPRREPAMPLAVGDRVRFRAISQREYQTLRNNP